MKPEAFSQFFLFQARHNPPPQSRLPANYAWTNHTDSFVKVPENSEPIKGPVTNEKKVL